MGYLLIGFSRPCAVREITPFLEPLRHVTLKGSYHRERRDRMRKAAKEIGISEDSAPFRSLDDDEREVGYSESVYIELASGEKLDGQLRPTGLLASNKSVDPAIIREDPNIQELLDVFREVLGIEESEIA